MWIYLAIMFAAPAYGALLVQIFCAHLQASLGGVLYTCTPSA